MHRAKASAQLRNPTAARQELSETLWALATLAVDPGPAATAALAARAAALLPGLGWPRACDLIYCLAAFGSADEFILAGIRKQIGDGIMIGGVLVDKIGYGKLAAAE